MVRRQCLARKDFTLCGLLTWILRFRNVFRNPYLFPATEKIVTAFMSNKHEMLTNMFASFRLLIPSVIISLVVAVVLGTIMGMNKKIREVLHPVIYAFSVIPSILLSPFVLLLSRVCFQHPYFWLYIILYGQHYLLQLRES